MVVISVVCMPACHPWSQSQVFALMAVTAAAPLSPAGKEGGVNLVEGRRVGLCDINILPGSLIQTSWSMDLQS